MQYSFHSLILIVLHQTLGCFITNFLASVTMKSEFFSIVFVNPFRTIGTCTIASTIFAKRYIFCLFITGFCHDTLHLVLNLLDASASFSSTIFVSRTSGSDNSCLVSIAHLKLSKLDGKLYYSQ